MNGIKLFIRVGGAMLLAAALIRFLIAAGNTPALTLPEPLIGVSIHSAVVVVGGIELVVALFCLFGRWPRLQLGGLALVATGYGVYVLVLLAKGIQVQGSCLGSLTDPLRIYRGPTGHVLQFLPFGLALGSYVAAVALLFSSDARTARLAGARQSAARRDAADGLMKMLCPACGGHVKFAAQNAGQQIPCPHCQAAIILRPADDDLKMSCVLCGGHVEFPAHAVGQKIACPHCAKPITLLKPPVSLAG
jgi:DNA-directed RNA polymerase subunit RPC12/RpoP